MPPHNIMTQKKMWI